MMPSRKWQKLQRAGDLISNVTRDEVEVFGGDGGGAKMNKSGEVVGAGGGVVVAFPILL